MSEKIQKVLARQGFASRREIERWIQDGRIIVNSQVAKLGDRITAKDEVKVDGRLIAIEAEQTSRVLMYHKPEGQICTRQDPEGRATVFDHLPSLHHARWVSVGRLDINTSGLLLLTNDGQLANQLMHPSSEIEREYAVRILGDVDSAMVKRLTKGVRLEDGMARFEHVVDSGGRGSNHWFHVLVKEGRNRLVRRLWESQQVVVSRLMRVRFGSVMLPKNLPKGQSRELSEAEIKALLECVVEK
ncbi:MAG: 23S rRNA pseudouridylate synthase B [Coxiellaceae bacterium]|nr:23S rRNA pseudouridylate synthase B [Coxiellaceae bacterium]|tara:strand:+ start:2044 stop:2775 length:732 start_codon:yes stop_codon:yes gene_type:complete